TSLAFILGVLPLTISVGAGAEMRQVLGIAVFSGMIGVTLFGLLFTPVFYVVVRWLASLAPQKKKKPATEATAPQPH
ncbi:MAG: efflux RND transporter permease subunit, partial [Bosea sp.]|nr:efflux RND transporter permease subunit [Bosea sp. (in: a-proteobacteria)]